MSRSVVVMGQGAPGSRGLAVGTYGPGNIGPSVNRAFASGFTAQTSLSDMPGAAPVEVTGDPSFDRHFCDPQTLAFDQDQQVSVMRLARDAGRRQFLFIRNATTANNCLIGIAFGREANLDSAITLAPGAQVGFDDVVPQSDIWIIALPGAGTVPADLARVVITSAALPI